LQLAAMRDYAAKRGWSLVAQIKEVGSGASQREHYSLPHDGAKSM
jgi:hypothetical protein